MLASEALLHPQNLFPRNVAPLGSPGSYHAPSIFHTFHFYMSASSPEFSMFFFRVGQGSHPLCASSQLCISALWRIITATLDPQNLYVKCNHFSYFCTPVKSQDPGNRMPELNSISSLLLGSQTERRYQSPNMYLDTIAEEKQYKSY